MKSDIWAIMNNPDEMMACIMLALVRKAGGAIEVTEEELELERVSDLHLAVDLVKTSDVITVRALPWEEVEARKAAKKAMDDELHRLVQEEIAADDARRSVDPNAVQTEEINANQAKVDKAVSQINAIAALSAESNRSPEGILWKAAHHQPQTPEDTAWAMAELKKREDDVRAKRAELAGNGFISVQDLEAPPAPPEKGQVANG